MSSTPAAPAARAADFGIVHLALADSRLALVVLNQLRYLFLKRLLGASREQANVLTAVLLLGAADGAYETARRVARTPLGVSGADAAMGASVLREAAFTAAGPGSRRAPRFLPLVAFAIAAGVAAPGLRRASRSLRAVEHRKRLEHMARYVAARRGAAEGL